MKKSFLFLLILFVGNSVAARSPWRVQIDLRHDECMFILEDEPYDYPIYGRVRVVTDPNEKATFDVCRVERYADEPYIFIREVFTDDFDCQEWRFVESGELYTIRWVETQAEADFSVCFTTSKSAFVPVRNDWSSQFIFDD